MRPIITFSFVTSLVVISSQYLPAQSDSVEMKKYPALDNFDISKYSLPDLKYKYLIFSGDFDSRMSLDNYNFKYDKTDDKTQRSNSNIGGNFYLSRYNYRNTKKHQFNSFHNIQINSKYISRNEKYSKNQIDSTYKKNDWKYNFSINSTNTKKSFNANNFFIKKGYEFSAEVGNEDFIIWIHPYFIEYSDLKNGYSFSLKPTIGFGKGRIEDVTDIWHAVRILKDLQRTGQLKQVPDTEKLMDLVKKISEIKNERVLDDRLKQKHEMKKLDEALGASGLVGEKNFDYYNSIFDMWFYGVDTRRFSNWEVGIDFSPLIDIYNFDHKLENNNRFQSGIATKIYYNNFKPLNMFWQLNYGTSLDIYYVTGGDFRSDFIDDKYLYIAPTASANITNFISSRAYFSSGIWLKYYHAIYESLDQNDSSVRIKFNNLLVYYLSPKSSLSANLNVDYNSYEMQVYSDFSSNSKSFTPSFRIGYLHSFY